MVKSIAFKNGFLIDGTGKDPVENATVVIEGNKITDIGGGTDANIPTDSKIIDVAGKTIMPGMIDAHMHLYNLDDPSEPCYPAWTSYLTTLWRMNSNDVTLYSANNAKQLLDVGFTGCRDLGGFSNWDNLEVVSVRNAVNKRVMPGCRIKVAGWMAPVAGHGAPGGLTYARSNLLFYYKKDGPTPASTGPWEIRERVRYLALQDLDQMKTVASGGGGEGGFALWTPEEFSALCDESHTIGKKVACHAYHPEEIKRALRAGVDTLEHCAYPDDEIIKTMLQRNIIGVPTLTHSVDKFCLGERVRIGLGLSEKQKKERLINNARRKECFQKMVDRGVKLALGTDIYFMAQNFVGENAHEFENMVEWGMTPMQTIVAATKIASEAMEMEDKIGTIETGKLADIIVVNGNPLKDVRVLQPKENIRLVMKDGIIEKTRGM